MSSDEIERLRAEIEQLRAALDFIRSLTAEALDYARVGTGEEVALRHAHRRAHEALAKEEGK